MAANDNKKSQAGDKRRLIIHFGVQKTGSTSIQRYLKFNAARLSNRLIIRIPAEETPMRALGQSAIKFSLREEDSEILFRNAFEEVLETLPANNLPVLISHENLSGAMPGKGGETALYPMLPKIARLLQKWSNGFKIEFILYTRDMDSWKRSVWAQAVRSDGYTKTYAKFLEETKYIPDWSDLIERISDSIGAKRLTRFALNDEPDLTHPARQILLHAGLSEAEIAELVPLKDAGMKQLNGASTEFLRQFNDFNLNPHARAKVIELVVRTQHLFNAEYRPEGTL